MSGPTTEPYGRPTDEWLWCRGALCDHMRSCRHSGNNPVPYDRPGRGLGGVMRGIRGRRMRCTPEYYTSRGYKAPNLGPRPDLAKDIQSNDIYPLPLAAKVEGGGRLLSSSANDVRHLRVLPATFLD